jgi:putrescine transport system ATP-binding protein
MRSGRIEQIGTPSDIYERPATRFVAGFIGAINMLPAKVDALSAGGFGRLTTPAGPASARLPAGLAAGAAATMTVRPERMRLARAGAAPADAITWDATVEHVIYLGARRELRLRLADGTLAVVEAANDGSQPFVRGDKLAAWFKPEDAWIIPESATA